MIHISYNEHVDHVPCSSPKYRNSGENLTKCLKAHLKTLTKLLLYSKYRIQVQQGNNPIFSCSQKGDLHNMAEIEKVESVPSCGRGSNIRCQHLISLIIYFSIHTLFSCLKKISESCGYIGLSACSSPQYRANSYLCIHGVSMSILMTHINSLASTMWQEALYTMTMMPKPMTMQPDCISSVSHWPNQPKSKYM